jgi:tetratricopeptide (TPR) repeat protein
MKAIDQAGLQDDIETCQIGKLREFGDYFTGICRYEKARGYYQKAIEAGVNDPLIYVGLANIALSCQDYGQAENYLERALELDEKCSPAYEKLAYLAQETGNYSIAFDTYLRCLKLDTDNLNALLGLFQVSCQMGSFSKVTFYLEKYLNTHPDDISVMFCLGALYTKDNRFFNAQQILNSLLKLDPGNQDAKNLLEEVEHNIFQKLS